MAGKHTLAGLRLRSNHDLEYLHFPTNDPAKNQLLHRKIPVILPRQPMSLPSINFLYLTVSEIKLEQNFKDEGH